MSPDIAHALVRTIELKDLSTAAHTWRVALYTRALAESAGLGHDEVERFTLAAALHDMGKIDIPDAILQKPGPLTEAEFEVMKTHTTLGHERLVRMGETDPILLALVRHHHERVDGGGYPDGLGGDRIPEPARYFAVVDSFDAMTSARVYRPTPPARTPREALAELEAGIGTRYCKECVLAFVRLYEADRLGWIAHAFDDTFAQPWTAREPVADVIARLRRA